MRRLLVVAEKEFRDHMTSKRFLAIFTILMLLSVVGIVTGMDNYNTSLDSYKMSQSKNQQDPLFKEKVTALEKQISDMEASGGSGYGVMALEQQLEQLNPSMPSALYFFGKTNDPNNGGFFSIILMLLSLALGFDLITREKEEGSLKSLLSHPIYRDTVINGKLMGALFTLIVVMGSMFLITLAVIMFYGVVPSADDLLRLGAYFIMALLFCGIFFGIATVFSTVSKTSTMSVLCVMGVMVAFVILPSLVPDITDAITGPAPIMSTVPASSNMSVNNSATSGQVVYSQAYIKYYQDRWTLTDTLDSVSPIYDFGTSISQAILYKESSQTGLAQSGNAEPSLLDSLAFVWTKILAMIVELAIPVAITYALFMRMDVQ